jgi:xanthine dehydrogenase YagS FAD-binding subunit
MDAFELVDARSPQEAVELLARHGRRAQPFASGADLLYVLKDRIAGPRMPSPEILVNLGRIAGLDEITWEPNGTLVIGAMTRLVQLCEDTRVRGGHSLLAEAAGRIASPQLRNTTTVAGNLCQRPRCWYFRTPEIVCLKKGGSTCWAVDGDNRWYHAVIEGGPCHIVHPSDLAPALVTLNARVSILGPGGSRELPIESFFLTTDHTLYQENALAEGEIISSIAIPAVPPGSRHAFEKATVRRADEFALVSVALSAVLRDATCVDCRITFGGVSPRPYRALAAERELRGKPISDEVVTAAAALAFATANPLSMNAYKVDLAAGVLRRAFRRSLEER